MCDSILTLSHIFMTLSIRPILNNVPMKHISLLCTIIVFEIISFLIGRSTQGGTSGWYQTLIKPPLNPPDWIFPIMWTLLYALIAAAGWVLWRNRSAPGGALLLILFSLYMLLNWTWSFIFFSAQFIFLGFIWIALLNCAALFLVIKSWNRARIAAILMLPSILWTIFAMYLNGALWYLN